MENEPPARPSSILHLPFPLVMALLLASQLCSCRSTPPLPSTDISGPGWRIQQGQAVWMPAQKRPELTGDFLLATNANGNFFVQYSKDPITLMTAGIVGDQWQIEIGEYGRVWHGRGTPPARFIWFQLPRALLDGRTTGDWRFVNLTTNSWRLANLRNGETLEGKFFK